MKLIINNKTHDVDVAGHETLLGVMQRYYHFALEMVKGIAT